MVATPGTSPARSPTRQRKVSPPLSPSRSPIHKVAKSPPTASGPHSPTRKSGMFFHSQMSEDNGVDNLAGPSSAPLSQTNDNTLPNQNATQGRQAIHTYPFHSAPTRLGGPRSIFWQRMAQEQQLLETNLETYAQNNLENSKATHRTTPSKLKLVPSPNIDVTPTHRSALEQKKEDKLLKLIRDGGSVSPTTKIANIRGSDPSTPSKSRKRRQTSDPTNLIVPDSPKKRFLNMLGISTGPTFKPAPQDLITPEPSKAGLASSTRVPPKAAQILGPEAKGFYKGAGKQSSQVVDFAINRTRTSGETDAQGDRSVKTRKSSSILGTSNANDSKCRDGATRQNRLVTNGNQARSFHNAPGNRDNNASARKTPTAELYNNDLPPTPPTKDSSANSSELRQMTVKGRAMSNQQGTLREEMESLKISNAGQRAYPEVIDLNDAVRSTYGEIEHDASQSHCYPRPSGSLHKRRGALADIVVPEPSAQPQYNMLARNMAMEALPTTLYSPSIYDNNSAITPSTHHFFPTPLQIPGTFRANDLEHPDPRLNETENRSVNHKTTTSQSTSNSRTFGTRASQRSQATLTSKTSDTSTVNHLEDSHQMFGAINNNILLHHASLANRLSMLESRLNGNTHKTDEIRDYVIQLRSDVLQELAAMQEVNNRNNRTFNAFLATIKNDIMGLKMQVENVSTNQVRARGARDAYIASLAGPEPPDTSTHPAYRKAA